MDALNFHKQKLLALIAGVVGLISCFLPWWQLSFFGAVNGLHGIGIVVFLSYLGAVGCCFAEEKSKPFRGQLKLIAAGCFALAAVFTVVQFGRASPFLTTSIGLWLALLAGIAGAVVVYLLKPEALQQPPEKQD